MSYMIKTVTILLFLSYLIVCSQAAQESSPLRMSNVRWKTFFGFKSGAAVSGRVEDDSLRLSHPPTDSCVISARIENMSAKTVKRIIWKVIFFADREKTELLGESKDFLMNVQVREWQNKAVEQPCYGKAKSRYMEGQAMRIEYADGSTWEAPRGGVLDLTNR